MEKQRKPTVSAKWLLSAAKKLEAEATLELPVLIVLGQVDRYDSMREKAHIMCRAAHIKSISERREFLRAHSIDA